MDAWVGTPYRANREKETWTFRIRNVQRSRNPPVQGLGEEPGSVSTRGHVPHL